MAEAGRRTVIIRGQVVDRYSPRRSMVEVASAELRPRRDAGASSYRSRRPTADAHYEPRHSAPRSRPDRRRRRPYDPPRSRPDRIAMWAVLLGIVLLLAAATGSHAAVIAHVAAH